MNESLFRREIYGIYERLQAPDGAGKENDADE